MSFLLNSVTTLFFYCILVFSNFGFGWVTARLLDLKFPPSEKPFSLVWLGWAITLLLLQIINLFAPLVLIWSLLLLLTGLIFAFISYKKESEYVSPFLKSRLWLGLVGIIMIFIAILSMQASKAYDSGLYHFNAIRWLNEYPIVLGLGNLHSRLAFNQSFFAFAAFLNLYPVFSHGQNIANGFLLFLLLAECIFVLLKQDKNDSQTSHTFVMFIFPTIIYLAIYMNISSPSPDTATYILQIMIFLYFIRDVIESPANNTNDSRTIFIFILSVTAITVKLNSLVYVITISLLLLISKLQYWRLPTKRAIAKITKKIVVPVIIMMVWVLRGILTSGCPVYPSTFGCINTSWSVPPELVKNLANVIYSWSRLPRVAPEKVLSSWEWLNPWFHTEILGNKSLFVYPLATACLFLIFCVFVYIHSSRLKATNKYLFLIPVPLLMGLIFWFFTAPSVRFAQALILMLPIAFVVMLISMLKLSENLTKSLPIVLFLLVNLNIAWAIWENPKPLTEISIQSFRPIKTVRLIKNTTLSGLEVFSPKKDDQCWDSELPCTPEFNDDLKFDNRIFFPEFKLEGENK